ncbi:Growth regulation protein [Wickerhamomyces ciferrii]|uniref:Growth regulation protein n=1 Tax=Wickerhamomyces ciferrii (strain ATCC 14091 / BCRC 22168 / CBS 111 / JCM 3599 / NBRC 0793 / NRRL Y-1031 F-60-10) TaxID=1206466 RepID=K0KHW5_WICCF|nr:Growth regulation protein [Wickerhamomyces ciferrii]CCH40994.1 Growth regulation protein [Wickerhamomyces ciferrii]
MSNPDIITQVSPEAPLRHDTTQIDEDVDLNSIIKLNIRGQMFYITRDELMSLPESILLCLFPNGVFVDINGNVITNLTEDDTVYVNFSPSCFQYIIDSFSSAAMKLPPSSTPEVYDGYSTLDADVLSEKPAIIVLREDLDYYVIPPKRGISPHGIRLIKQAAGSYLVNREQIFEGLGYEPGKKLGPAEEHLLEMLCSSGFDVQSDWGHRSSEPGKTVLTSLSLVDLKHPEPPQPEPESPSLNPVASNSTSNKQSRRSRIAELAESAARSASRSVSRNRSESRAKSAGTSSKLLLFWRKPARKCWWSNTEVTIQVPGLLKTDGLSEVTVNLHIRRVWTLELSVIGVH